MTIYSCDMLVQLHNDLGEGPVWDNQGQSLYWIDGLGCKWFRLDADGKISQFETQSPIGSMVLSKCGDIIAALREGIYRINPKTGASVFLVNPEEGISGNRFNDGKADISGRYVVGTMSEANNDGSGNAKSSGSLYSIKPDGTWNKLRGNIGISNGMAWNKTGDRFYYIDSVTGCVYSYSYNAQTGLINDERICVRIPPDEGIPDGMTIDEDGKLWIAQWGGWCVSRYDPINGELLGKVQVPVKHVTCCTFGGKAMDKLYITTSTNGVSGIQWLKQPLAGALFVASPGIRGCAPFLFGG